ncbi:MAG: hypothetical protein LC663_00850 [Actinobacteria bacterium]|nr:hypothetical protein [Actinomycetota bacterium]
MTDEPPIDDHPYGEEPSYDPDVPYEQPQQDFTEEQTYDEQHWEPAPQQPWEPAQQQPWEPAEQQWDGWEHQPAEEPVWYEPEPQPAVAVEPQPRARGRLGVILLVATLVLSLAANAFLGVRYRDQRSDLKDLRARIARLESPAPSVGISPIIQQIIADVARIRQLAFKKPVPPEVLSLDAFRERVRTEVMAQIDRHKLEVSERVLVELGVIPTGYDLVDAEVNVQLEQVAGFYDDNTKKLVVPAEDAENPSPLTRETLAHEYTHALTDQYFNLGRLDALQSSGRDDRALAFLSLVEGDAEAVRTRYVQTVFTQDDRDRADEEAQSVPATRFEAAPKFLQDVLVFPYTYGTAFVNTLIERGGFAAVDAAYRDPPSSSEQIIHPERYFGRRDLPVNVSMPNLGAALGAGWSPLDSGDVGEFDLQLIGQYGGEGLSLQDARAAAEGWDGGRYVALSSGTRTVVGILTAWDSGPESAQAAALYARWLPLRFNNDGSSFRAGKAQGWAGPAGAGEVSEAGGKVLILLGAARSDLDRARAAFKGF